MKTKISATVVQQINLLVAIIKGYTYRIDEKYGLMVFAPGNVDSVLVSWSGEFPDYCGDWEQAGPIIERESISVVCAVGDGIWSAYPCDKGPVHNPAQQVSTGSIGPTPLVAAMRCYIASKLGDEVEVPDELP